MSDPQSIGTYSETELQIEPSAEYRRTSRIASPEEYERLYRESLEQPEQFWKRELGELVFRDPWSSLLDWSSAPHARWFNGATLNITESCLDRHLATPTRHKRAIVWEGEKGDTRTVTYEELHQQVCAFAAALRGLGVKR